MNLGLLGKNALVIGGSRGLGAAICQVFAEEGVNLIIESRKKEHAEKIGAELCQKYGIQCMAIGQDLSEENAADRIFEKALHDGKHLDILVNSAAIWPQSYVKDMTESELKETLHVNLTVPCILCKKFIRHVMEEKNKGRIINIVSQAAFSGSTTGHAHYAASKGGLVSFTISLAREVAKHEITVNAIVPGIMDTDMMNQSLTEKRQYYIERIPIGRIADPLEVAYGAAYLASDQADYITGIALDITGGMLMR